MGIYTSIIKGLQEAIEYERGKQAMTPCNECKHYYNYSDLFGPCTQCRHFYEDMFEPNDEEDEE